MVIINIEILSAKSEKRFAIYIIRLVLERQNIIFKIDFIASVSKEKWKTVSRI